MNIEYQSCYVNEGKGLVASVNADPRNVRYPYQFTLWHICVDEIGFSSVNVANIHFVTNIEFFGYLSMFANGWEGCDSFDQAVRMLRIAREKELDEGDLNDY